jgi:hypothetical protein
MDLAMSGGESAASMKAAESPTVDGVKVSGIPAQSTVDVSVLDSADVAIFRAFPF